MGIDLTLAIDRHESEDMRGWFLCYDRLSVNRDSRLYAQVERVPSFLVPKSTKVSWYDDPGIKTITEDCYGTPLKYVLAGDLAQAFKGCGWYNKAIFAFLKALNPQTAIILYWH